MKKHNSLMKRALFLVVAMSLYGIMVAQTKTITGVVKETTGDPIIGVSVVVKGTTIATITNFEGNFSLQVPTSANTLVFSYVGMKKLELPVAAGKMNVVMEQVSNELNELVVIGYGTVRKSDLTGSVSSVNSKTVNEKGVTNIVSAMQGSVAGVQITQNSSRAGAAYDIIIRGQNSVSGTYTPLYVVDGVITSSIDFLNPQDIEKIDILKDASSTAIYGSRGSHGVVIVQTKSGKSVQQASKAVISYDGYYGVSNTARSPNFMNTQQWMQYRALNYQYTTDTDNNGVLDINPLNKSDLKNVWFGGVQYQDLNNGKGAQSVYANGTWGGSQWMLDRYLSNATTDWAGLVTRQGNQQNHYIDISGSTKDVAYVVGIGYQNEKGVFVNDNYNRYNLKGSVTANLNSKWSTGFTLNTAYSTQETGSDNAILSAYRMAPITTAYTNGNLDPTLNHLEGNIIVVPGKTTETVKDANGNPSFLNSIGGGGFTSSINPLIDLANTSNNTQKVLAMGSAFLQYSPIKNLTFKTTILPSYNTYRTGLYKSTLAEGNYDNPLTTAVENDAKASVNNYSYFNYTWDNQVDYKFTLNSDHNLDVMGLYSIFAENSELYTTNTAGYNFNYEWYNLGAASTTANTKLTSSYTESSMISYAARARYAYKGKYLITATIRNDVSSKLAEGYKAVTLPSASVAWRVSEEKFMESTRNVISNLKLRASYGNTANNNINAYQTQTPANLQTYYNFGSTNALGVAPGSLASKVLTWEKTREFDLGMDLGLWNNRIDLTVDLYNRLSTDLLQPLTLPLESGAGTMTSNLGSVRNQGIEIALNANIINTKKLRWSVSGTFTTNQNKIMNLFGNTTDGYIFINSNTQKWMVGQDINSIYGYVYDGVWTADGILTAIANKDPRAVNSAGKVLAREGQAKVKDFDNNGIDAKDRRIQGHSDPSYTAGLSTNLSYRGFDFAMTLYTAQGMTVFSPFIEEFTNYNDRGRQKLVMDYYIPAGTTMIGSDGYFYTQQTAVNNQGRPMVYTDNATKANCGPYWHTARETANEMPGCWVDASFIKVRNITLGYTLPKSVVKALDITSFRIYCNVLNPFVFTNYQGFDPEWAGASMGKDNGPATITYQLGVNVKF